MPGAKTSPAAGLGTEVNVAFEESTQDKDKCMMVKTTDGDKFVEFEWAQFGSRQASIAHVAAVLCDPERADQDLRNAELLNQTVAVVKRGGNKFVGKAKRAQLAGALALIIINTENTVYMPSGDDTAVTIPVVLVASKAGAALLQDGAHVTLVGIGGDLPDLTKGYLNHGDVQRDKEDYFEKLPRIEGVIDARQHEIDKNHALESRPHSLAVRELVQIHSLVSHAEHNEKIGRLVKYNTEKDRWIRISECQLGRSDMALEPRACLLSLKPSNLQRRDYLVLGENMSFSTPRLSITDDEFDALRPGDRVKVGGHLIAVEVLEPEVLVDKGVIQQLLDAMNSSTESTGSTCLRFVLEARQISEFSKSKVVDFEMLPHLHLVEFSNNNSCKDRSTSSQELETLKPGDTVKVAMEAERFWCEVKERRSDMMSVRLSSTIFVKAVEKQLKVAGLLKATSGGHFLIKDSNVCGISVTQEGDPSIFYKGVDLLYLRSKDRKNVTEHFENQGCSCCGKTVCVEEGGRDESYSQEGDEGEGDPAMDDSVDIARSSDMSGCGGDVA